MNTTIHFLDEKMLMRFANKLANCIKNPLCIYLIGDLGVGKTTFIRSLLMTYGIQGPIRSPSFNVIEEYFHNQQTYLHIDLYRLKSVAELEFLAYQDYAIDKTYFFIEWPLDHPQLPPADIKIKLSICNQGRECQLVSLTEKGNQVLTELNRQT